MSMPFSVDDLRRILRDSAGESNEGDLTGDIADRDFEDLGYDSIALLEVAACIERRFGVEMESETISALTTPGALVNWVNENVASPAVG